MQEKFFSQFCKLGFCKKDQFEKGFTRVFPCINPIMNLGYEDELAKATSTINRFTNIYSVGGAAEFSYGDMQVMFSKANDTVELFSSSHYLINKNLKVSSNFKFNEEVVIGSKKVGKNNPTMIIAEIGINHQGSKKILKDLLMEVKKSNCDYAKIQSYAKNSRVSSKSKAAQYADKTLDMEENLSEMFDRVRLSDDDHKFAFEWCKKNNLPLISTPFDEESCDYLMQFNPDAFKIASFDSVNLPLLKYVASKQKPIILSTGMCGMSEIEEALDSIASQGNPNVAILHCVSMYPTAPQDVNLKAIQTINKTFKVPTGYSDHTIGNIVPTASMAMGAHILEKHFTLSKDLEGSDHSLSATPKELKELIKTRDIIFTAMGSGIKKPSTIENLSVNLQRKSIFIKKDIKKGTKISLENITVKGPGHGLLPKYIDLVLGKKSNKRCTVRSSTDLG